MFQNFFFILLCTGSPFLNHFSHTKKWKYQKEAHKTNIMQKTEWKYLENFLRYDHLKCVCNGRGGKKGKISNFEAMDFINYVHKEHLKAQYSVIRIYRMKNLREQLLIFSLIEITGFWKRVKNNRSVTKTWFSTKFDIFFQNENIKAPN